MEPAFKTFSNLQHLDIELQSLLAFQTINSFNKNKDKAKLPFYAKTVYLLKI